MLDGADITTDRKPADAHPSRHLSRSCSPSPARTAARRAPLRAQRLRTPAGGLRPMTVQEHASRPGGTSAAALFSTSPRDGRGREGLAFASTQARCTAWQWQPEGADAAPCLVLAYGSSGLEEQRPN